MALSGSKIVIFYLIKRIAIGAPNGLASIGSAQKAEKIYHESRCKFEPQCLLTQGASLHQYIGAGIPIFDSFVHSFISLSPYLHSLSYLRHFPLSTSIFLAISDISLYPSPSSSPFLSPSISQQTKMILKGEAYSERLSAFPLFESPLSFALLGEN